MGAIISIIRVSDKMLLYLSGLVFVIALIVLFGITYYVTGTPFGTEIPTPKEISITTTTLLAGELVVLTTTWVFCPIIMIVSLVLFGLFSIVKFGLAGGKNK
jgi:hypothetical protein